MMVNPRFLSFLMPIVAGGVLLWYKKRNFLEKEEKEGNDSGEGGGGGGEETSGADDAQANSSDRCRDNADVNEDQVVLASSLISFRVEDKSQPEVLEDNAEDCEPLPAMPSFDDNDNEIPSRRQSESASSEVGDDDDLSDVEFQQKRVLDWAEEGVSISEEDLDADLESLLQNCFNASAVDDSPSSRRLKMRQAHAARAGSEASGVSVTSIGSGDDNASSSSWRHNSGGDANALTPRSAWNSLQNTPDVKRSPRNRRLKRSGGNGDDSVQSTPSGGERACPVISCTPNTPSSGVTSSGVTSSGLTATPTTKDGSDSNNWRAHMGQWDELARSHNSPIDRCSEVSDDSGQGGSDGVPSLSIASPDDIVIYEFEFPSELCGRLIGKGGRNLQQLMMETNTRLALRKQPFTEDHQIVSVTGRQEDVQSVLQSVRQKFPRHRNPEVDLRPVQMPLPQDLLVPDIMPLSLPEDVPVEVIVSAVVSTAHIFVQMPTQPTFPNLPHLDACMLACYSQDGAPPLPSPIEGGVICAAPQSGGWYRAQIVEIVPSTTTTTAAEDESEKSSEEASSFDAYVRFVDYGGYAYIPVTSLRQIRSDFIALPFQAVECYLAYMSPPNEDSYEFPIEGAFHLEQLVKDAAAAATEVGGSGLKAETVAYAEGGIPCVYLYPSAGSKKGEEEAQEQQDKISINEALVAHGDAKWIPYYDGANVTEEEKEGSVENQQQPQDIYGSSMSSSITSSFTEDDVVSAVVFTPLAMRSTLPSSSSSSESSVFDDELVKDTVEIDVQNISQSSNSGLKTIADNFSATEDISLTSLSLGSHTTLSSLPHSSDTTFQLDCESQEFPKLHDVAAAVSPIAV